MALSQHTMLWGVFPDIPKMLDMTADTRRGRQQDQELVDHTGHTYTTDHDHRGTEGASQDKTGWVRALERYDSAYM